jgi:hypothetical protein
MDIQRDIDIVVRRAQLRGIPDEVIFGAIDALRSALGEDFLGISYTTADGDTYGGTNTDQYTATDLAERILFGGGYLPNAANGSGTGSDRDGDPDLPE